jgi:predicted NAD-dependent protein-ADP-ribosyltransferase YbiA (DUF1768 family)
MTEITNFYGEYYAFSNFYPQSIIYKGKSYPTSEHATLDNYWRRTGFRNYI